MPAFYSRWLLNRLRAGFCHWVNPFGGGVQRVSLRPEDCLALVFWTRHPRPLLPHLSLLRTEGYRFYWHVTINGYPRSLETHGPSTDVAIRAFRDLSAAIGPDRVFWRYDPILVSDLTPASYHVEQIDRLATALEGYTHRCYFSFVTAYGKTARNLGRVEQALLPKRRRETDSPGMANASPPRTSEASLVAHREHGVRLLTPLDDGARLDLVRRLSDVAAERGIVMYSCCGDLPPVDGVERAHCVDADVLRALWTEANPGVALPSPLRPAPTRPRCGCAESVDVGAYDTCTFGCAYCYATNSRRAARARQRAHDPDDTLLWRPRSLQGVDLELD